MAYDFKTLSPADFEDLARDLIGAQRGIPFEGFGPGPDGGVDGRHAAGGVNVVLQAKHKAGSTFASSKSAMKNERKSIDRIKPDRYILATSQSLTPNRESQLTEIIGPTLNNAGDIFGCTELNGILRRHVEIERAHIKLWLSSAAVLNRFLRSAAFAHTATSREEMLDKLRIFAPNPSFAKSHEILEHNHVLIVSGAPGVGKTTLAQMLVYAYIGEEWEFIAVRNLDDGFAEIEDAKKQIFFFDDFLGKIKLDRNALAAKDTELARFIRRVQRSKNARFILTTRAYIYEEARRISENIGDRRLDISKYVLDVSVYTRRVRARILYNHLVASSLPIDYVRALTTGDVLPNIVDHEHYNPRIIEWMTDATLLSDVLPKNYADSFVHMLDHPIDIWDRAFREHIPLKAQHLLICLFFCPEWGEEIDDLRSAFEAVHHRLCKKYRHSSAPTDFEDSLKLLEGSFLNLHGGNVLYINPSVRDYLNKYLNDLNWLPDLAQAAQSADWARTVWQHYKNLEPSIAKPPSTFPEHFRNIGKRFKDLPTWRTDVESQGLSACDLALTDRCSLLAEWEIASGKVVFAEALRCLVFNPPDSFSSWRDGPDLPSLIMKFRNGVWEDVTGSNEIADELEITLVEIIRAGNCTSQELERIRGAIEYEYTDFSGEVLDSLVNAITYELNEAWSIAGEYVAESELEDHAENLKKLAEWAKIESSSALLSVEERLEELREEDLKAEEPSFPTGAMGDRDDFDDESLKSMFEVLAQG